jgi:hypothetical protein
MYLVENSDFVCRGKIHHFTDIVGHMADNKLPKNRLQERNVQEGSYKYYIMS